MVLVKCAIAQGSEAFDKPVQRRRGRRRKYAVAVAVAAVADVTPKCYP